MRSGLQTAGQWPGLSAVSMVTRERAVRGKACLEHIYYIGSAALHGAENLAGRVAINGMLDEQQAPFGGIKHSGVGREFRTFRIEAILEPKAVLEWPFLRYLNESNQETRS